MNHTHTMRIGWLSTLALCFSLLFPTLCSWGVFLDGVTYATVSRNLAIGLGTVWRPFYTATLYPEFFEQPPLAFVLQSLLFSWFGEHYLVEKAYCFIAMIATLCLFPPTWKEVTQDHPTYRTLGWVPVLLWITIPKWQWTYKNNMLDSTLTFFCLLAFLLFFWAVRSEEKPKVIIYTTGAALSLILGFLVKGPVAFFPLTTPFLCALCLETKKFRKALLITILAIFVLGIASLLLWNYTPARESLSTYFNQHVFRTIVGARPLEDHPLGRAYLLVAFVEQYWLSAFLLALITFLSKRKDEIVRGGNVRAGLFILLVAMSCVLPLAVSPKQHSYYLFPSFPFWSLGIAFFIVSRLRSPWLGQFESFLQDRRKPASALIALVFLTSLILGISNIGKPRRKYQDLYSDLQTLKTTLDADIVIGGSAGLKTDWVLHATLHRHLRVSLDATESATSRNFYLRVSGDQLAPSSGFTRTNLTLKKFALYERKQTRDFNISTDSK